MSLFLTPTRLELLTACHEKRVVVNPLAGGRAMLSEAGYPIRTVQSRIEELERAGYVALDEAEVFWRPTQAGRDAAGWKP